jgi:hypothetical protein
VKTASAQGKPTARTRGLLRCGQVAGPGFVAVFLLEGAVRDGYLPLRHPVSSLALGPRAWRSWRVGQPRFALYSASTAITMTATAAQASAGFGQSPQLVNLGGLFQRASIISGKSVSSRHEPQCMLQPVA